MASVPWQPRLRRPPAVGPGVGPVFPARWSGAVGVFGAPRASADVKAAMMLVFTLPDWSRWPGVWRTATSTRADAWTAARRSAALPALRGEGLVNPHSIREQIIDIIVAVSRG